MSNYPPGVTGLEPEIAGYPEEESEQECPGCGELRLGMAILQYGEWYWSCYWCEDHGQEGSLKWPAQEPDFDPPEDWGDDLPNYYVPGE